MDYPAVKIALETHGFAKVESAFTLQELKEAEDILDVLMNSPRRAVTRFRKEMAEQSDPGVIRQPELLRPALLARRLRRCALYSKCRAIAEGVLGTKAHYLFDHAIYKMPQSETVTPWHQDQAYLGATIPFRSLHFWIPFQDTSSYNGSMQFVSDGEPKFLPHFQVFKSNPHILGIGSEPQTINHQTIMSKGDATIHTNLTLHSTGPNRSDAVRKAWIVHFGDRPAWYKHYLQMKSRLGL